MISKPLLLAINYQYFFNLLRWKNINYQPVGELFKIDDFVNYNHLIDINNIFSTVPKGDPVDRTLEVTGPLNFRVLRPWKKPQTNLSLEDVFRSRVEFYTQQNHHLNLFWSGGIDSTAMVVSFLKHSPNIDQLRLIYSPYSLYENRDFFEFVTKKFPSLQTVDISGDVYINNTFKGINITGHGGDEFTASIDDTFFESVGTNGLHQNWKDFFYKKTQNQQLIDFCEGYFLKSGKDIQTVLEARWWFYSVNKSQVFAPRDISFLFNQSPTSLDMLQGFFDFVEFEDYMWNNTDCIIKPGGEYKTYKKFLKEYTHQFYPSNEYLENACKANSIQFSVYRRKKTELLDLRWICILDDLSVIRTKNLPLLSRKEFDAKYGNSLDYLFNFLN
jgi:hypothetical protein